MSRLALLCAACAAALVSPAAAPGATAPCRPDGGPRCQVWRGEVDFVADGDTIDVDIAGDGTGRPQRIRFIGTQAMEQRTYSRNPARRRGECHALRATARLERLVRAARGRVRLSAQHAATRDPSGRRLRRSVALRIRGRWVDAGARLVAAGDVLWDPHGVEWQWNATYRRLARQAAARGVGLYDRDACGAGPSAAAPLTLSVHWDAEGNDADNVNGEWFAIRNGGSVAVPLAGWWVRDSAPRRYRFPPGTVAPAHGTLRVHVGRGTDGPFDLHWGLGAPAFENATYDERSLGDGGYLFDPQGDLRAWDIYPVP